MASSSQKWSSIITIANSFSFARFVLGSNGCANDMWTIWKILLKCRVNCCTCLLCLFCCFDWIGLASLSYSLQLCGSRKYFVMPRNIVRRRCCRYFFFSLFILKHFLLYLLLHYSLFYVRSWWDVIQFVGRFHFIELWLLMRPYASLRIFKTSTTSCSLIFSLLLPLLIQPLLALSLPFIHLILIIFFVSVAMRSYCFQCNLFLGSRNFSCSLINDCFMCAKNDVKCLIKTIIGTCCVLCMWICMRACAQEFAQNGFLCVSKQHPYLSLRRS